MVGGVNISPKCLQQGWQSGKASSVHVLRKGVKKVDPTGSTFPDVAEDVADGTEFLRARIHVASIQFRENI